MLIHCYNGSQLVWSVQLSISRIHLHHRKISENIISEVKPMDSKTGWDMIVVNIVMLELH